ncbi:MAG: glycosyl transferase family 2 [Pararhizobium sp.]
MISVLIEAGQNDEEALARSLAALVPGAIEGLIREVVVIDRGAGDGTRLVAEAAGCRVVAKTGAREAVAMARADWLLLLEAGARPVGGWIERIGGHIGTAEIAARLSPARGGRVSFLARLREPSRPLRYGLLITKRQAVAVARPGQPLEAIARGLATRRLACEIVPSGL